MSMKSADAISGSVGAGLLAGEGALVTGAATSIGKATAELLAREGARVLLADLDCERGEATAAALRAEGLDAQFEPTDLSQRAGALALAGSAQRRLGRVSLFVHSAAPPRREADTLFNVSDDTFDAMVNVNATSGFVLGRELARHMLDHQIRGRMVYITSLHSITPRNLPHYSSAKAAQSMVAKELAKALAGHCIRVNAVAPGVVLGGGFKPSPEHETLLRNKIPMGRSGGPQEVAQVVLTLLVDRYTSYVTGATIPVDGGLSLFNWIEPGPLW